MLMKRLIFTLATLLGVLTLQVKGQTYIYSTVSVNSYTDPASSVTGSGSWSAPTVLSNYTFSTTSNSSRIDQVTHTLGGASSEVNASNAWESKYGEIDPDAANCIKVRSVSNASSSGAPLGDPITTVVTFSSVTPTTDWGFLVLDIDVDQVTIRATDAGGAYYPITDISRWFKGTLNMSSSTGSTTPWYDAAAGTVVGFDYPPVKQTTLSPGNDVNGPAAYFEPNQPVKTLEFIFDNLQPTATPSQRYFIAAKDVSALPVNLISFTAENAIDHALLTWLTASESFNKGFEIERSNDALTWKRIGYAESLSQNGTSDETLQYSFKDVAIMKGQNYYRLKQIDLDGTFGYSPIRVVLSDKEKAGQVMIFPNPTTDYVTLAELSGNEKIHMYDAQGRKIKSVQSTGSTTDISMDGVKEGMYFIHVIQENGEITYHKIIKRN